MDGYVRLGRRTRNKEKTNRATVFRYFAIPLKEKERRVDKKKEEAT